MNSSLLIGGSGSVVTTNTDAVEGNFHAIQILEAATFSALVDSSASGQAMTGFEIPAGIILFGGFTNYTLSGGKVRAYRRG